MEMFSSQASQAESSDEMGFKAAGQYLEWPRIVDTIGLCYLAAILMRLPICINDFHRYYIASFHMRFSTLWQINLLTSSQVNRAARDTLHPGIENYSS